MGDVSGSSFLHFSDPRILGIPATYPLTSEAISPLMSVSPAFRCSQETFSSLSYAGSKTPMTILNHPEWTLHQLRLPDYKQEAEDLRAKLERVREEKKVIAAKVEALEAELKKARACKGCGGDVVHDADICAIEQAIHQR